MRACPACGASNGPDDDFCGNCGAYLGWSAEAGRSVEEPDPAADAPTPSQESRSVRREGDDRTPGADDDPPSAPAGSAPGTTPGAAGTTPRAAGTTPGSADAPSTPAAPAAPPASAAPHAPPDPSTPPTPPVSSAPTPAAPPARPAPPAPRAPEPAEPDPRQPAPVQPAKAVAPRPVVRPVPEREEVVGPPCPACGTPNPPGRRFCRRCATPLDPRAAAEALPWWRTVWPFRRRVRAGSGRWVRLLVILVVVAALCVGGFLLLPAGRSLVEDTRDKLGGTKAVTPVHVTASASVSGHPASNTTDGLSNRYWGAPGPGASVTYTFGKPFRLVDLIITNGASDSPQQYATEARALQMDMEVTSSDGTVHHKSVSLGDKAGPQTVATGIDDVVGVRLVLRSVTGLTAGRHVALAEVEFFQRS
ncbi:hypothetical protein STEPF1_04612 [Streptomyces sp. F-1]|nr:hypothetical protein STEPF1_04612 [Streptomyces sp. F-1]